MEIVTAWLNETVNAFGGFSLLIIAAGVMVVLVISVLLFLQRAQTLRCLAKLNELEKKTTVISSGSVGLGQRLMALEKKLIHLQGLQDDIRQQDLEFSYTQAQKLVEQGLDSRTIAANSGLSVSEVDLMQTLYGKGRSRHVA